MIEHPSKFVIRECWGEQKLVEGWQMQPTRGPSLDDEDEDGAEEEHEDDNPYPPPTKIDSIHPPLAILWLHYLPKLSPQSDC